MKIDILNVKISKTLTKQVLEQIRDFLYSEKKHYIVTPNPEFIMEAQKDKEFRKILNNADIAIPDGIGLLWAGKYLSLNISHLPLLKHLRALWQIIYTGASLIFYPKYCKKIFPERIAGSDLIWSISRICVEEGKSVYLLGASYGIAAMTAQRLKSRLPNLKIAGTFSGGQVKPEADQKICAIINNAKPDILFVAFGHPKQEKWIARNLENLKTVKVAMGVGGSYDFIVGKAKRAPKFFQKLGIEWLWRFFHQPWRAKRIITATWRFIWTVYKFKIQKGMTN